MADRITASRRENRLPLMSGKSRLDEVFWSLFLPRFSNMVQPMPSRESFNKLAGPNSATRPIFRVSAEGSQFSVVQLQAEAVEFPILHALCLSSEVKLQRYLQLALCVGGV